MPRAFSTAIIAARHAATLACPPNSPTKRPPGLSARHTPATTLSGCCIQCSAALENRVEFGIESQCLPVHHVGVQALSARGLDHLFAGVDANNLTALLGQFLGQYAVATAQVENPLARPWIKQLQHRHAQYGYEAGVGLITIRLPVLGRTAHSPLPLE